MRPLILIISFIFCLGAGCEDDKNDGRGLVIMTGEACGWCSAPDSLALTSSKSVYNLWGACGEPDKAVTENTRREEWADLRASLNWDDFKKINVNTCALCADGCDTWIRIQNGDESHYIRFTESSPEIEPIRAFVERLRVIHERFRQK